MHAPRWNSRISLLLAAALVGMLAPLALAAPARAASLSDLRLNEVRTFHGGSDVVEIHNTGPDPVSLDGAVLAFAFLGGEGSQPLAGTIGGHGYLIVGVTMDDGPGYARILDATGGSPAVEVDRVDFDAFVSTSWQLCPDASTGLGAAWVVSPRPSLGGRNVCVVDTTTTLEVAPTSPAYGETVELTATVASVTGPDTPDGTVIFSDGDTVLGTAVLDATGTATLDVDDLAVGGHALTASYVGVEAFRPSESVAVALDVARASTTTTLTAAPASVTYGDPVTLTATLTPGSGSGPTGSVSFSDGDSLLGTAVVDGDGTARLTVDLAAGSHRLSASYAGDARFAPSASEMMTLEVAKAPTSLTATAYLRLWPLGLGHVSATLTSRGAPLPGATVEFLGGATVVCRSTTDAAGVATCAAPGLLLPALLDGGYTVRYAGDASHDAATARGALIG
ncbi:Ig-like domain repeat protein [Nocardioides albidus]|uniref:Ig-like domain repeat protein n=1 Tax=Nocardioides albidus TaxID=1517589 RepID=A0A5C4VL85_9ACTN|nr:Ig-like domain-containing protein [Nocardioides albidus]TNM36316.1 Ig-like domain repeat protein [Nocardioides albidus]